jgi:hypothetical protein
MYEIFSAYSIGAKHLLENKPCQDFAFHVKKDTFSLAVVADGHGHDDCLRSEKRSRYAVYSACRCIPAYIESIEKEYVNSAILNKTMWDALLRGLERRIVNTWNEKVRQDCINNPITAKELEKVSDMYKERYRKGRCLEIMYGTTLLALAVTDAYWFGLHIGDGTCVVVYADGLCKQPIPCDKECFFNVTTSLCNTNAALKFRHYVSSFTHDEKPVAVFIGSDGVDNSYPKKNKDKHLSKLYKSLAVIFAKKGLISGGKQVQEFLPVLTREGSGDDVSIAGFIDIEKAVQMRNLKRLKKGKKKEAAEPDMFTAGNSGGTGTCCIV